MSFSLAANAAHQRQSAGVAGTLCECMRLSGAFLAYQSVSSFDFTWFVRHQMKVAMVTRTP